MSEPSPSGTPEASECRRDVTWEDPLAADATTTCLLFEPRPAPGRPEGDGHGR